MQQRSPHPPSWPPATPPPTPTPRARWLLGGLLLAAVAAPLGPPAAAQAQGAGPATQVGAPTLEAAPSREAAPGSYVTLTFAASGQGEYVLEVESPPDWVPVTRRRTLTLRGRTLVPVTFQVPDFAPVGPSPPLVLRMLAGGNEVARAESRVGVLGRARVGLRGPLNVEAAPGERLTVPVEVRNLGNEPDTVRLRATNVDGRPRLSVPEVRLAPGESATVTVSLETDRVSEEYRYVIFLEAESARNPEVRARARTDVVYRSAAGQQAAALEGPSLLFRVRTSAEVGVTWSPAGTDWSVRYALQPTLSGALSDYVRGQAGVSGLSGDRTDPLPSLGSTSFGVQLGSERWTANLSLGAGGGRLDGTVRWGAWQLSPSASYTRLPDGRAASVGVRASTEVAGGQLDLDAGTFLLSRGEEDRRTDLIGVRYVRSLFPGLDLTLGVAGVGQAEGGAYRGNLVWTQELRYQGTGFDVTQSYRGGLDGVHTFGVTGGLTALQPFGVRVAAAAQLQPGGLLWSGSGTLLYSGPGGLGASLSGRVEGGTVPGTELKWSVSAGVVSPTFVVGGASLRAAGLYTLATDDDVPGALTHKAALSAGLNRGPLQVAAQAAWERNPEPEGMREQLSGAAQLDYRPGADAFAVRFTLNRLSEGGAAPVTTTGLGLRWERQWTPRLTSAFEYGRTWTVQPQSVVTADLVGVTVGVRDLGLQGLNLSGSYRLEAPQGLGGGDLRHAVRLGVSYDLRRTFATPEAVVNFFGGRVGGEVTGVLYRDLDLNGQRGPDEPPLAGVTVEIGGARGVSDAAGRYRVRAPVGEHELKFPAGLPATVEALAVTRVKVTENGRLEENVAFAPVTRLEAVIFHDANRNGTQDPGENPLPYVGVVLSGPVSRQSQSDARGTVRLGGLPAGEYTLALDPTRLPEGYTPTGAAQTLALRPGEPVPAPALGAALPPREAVTTFVTGALAVFGRLTPSTASPGATLTVQVQTQNARSLRVEAFGQVLTPPLGAEGRTEVPLAVPPATPPGTYDVVVTAVGEGTSRSTTLKLVVTPR
ncbi:SdrD B-like domain-containing protein [Deinococcus sp. RL]|uniref:SdrD B-like domain-containing protein n=1 Tax=Deinococcus sp. RL TaxID=1489678 RepID=UPI001267C4FC|nr:SdrD B-like domain-containing protein [Deinococcus sp. RL]